MFISTVFVVSRNSKFLLQVFQRISYATNYVGYTVHVHIKDSLTYRPSSQGWAPSPTPVLKAGHPAPPQFSRLGTQGPAFLFFRFVCCVLCILCVLEVLSLLHNFSVARMLYTCFSMYVCTLYCSVHAPGTEAFLPKTNT